MSPVKIKCNLQTEMSLDKPTIAYIGNGCSAYFPLSHLDELVRHMNGPARADFPSSLDLKTLLEIVLPIAQNDDLALLEVESPELQNRPVELPLLACLYSVYGHDPKRHFFVGRLNQFVPAQAPDVMLNYDEYRSLYLLACHSQALATAPELWDETCGNLDLVEAENLKCCLRGQLATVVYAHCQDSQIQWQDRNNDIHHLALQKVPPVEANNKFIAFMGCSTIQLAQEIAQHLMPRFGLVTLFEPTIANGLLQTYANGGKPLALFTRNLIRELDRLEIQPFYQLYMKALSATLDEIPTAVRKTVRRSFVCLCSMLGNPLAEVFSRQEIDLYRARISDSVPEVVQAATPSGQELQQAIPFLFAQADYDDINSPFVHCYAIQSPANQGYEKLIVVGRGHGEHRQLLQAFLMKAMLLLDPDTVYLDGEVAVYDGLIVISRNQFRQVAEKQSYYRAAKESNLLTPEHLLGFNDPFAFLLDNLEQLSLQNPLVKFEPVHDSDVEVPLQDCRDVATFPLQPALSAPNFNRLFRVYFLSLVNTILKELDFRRRNFLRRLQDIVSSVTGHLQSLPLSKNDQQAAQQATSVLEFIRQHCEKNQNGLLVEPLIRALSLVMDDEDLLFKQDNFKDPGAFVRHILEKPGHVSDYLRRHLPDRVFWEQKNITYFDTIMSDASVLNDFLCNEFNWLIQHHDIYDEIGSLPLDYLRPETRRLFVGVATKAPTSKDRICRNRFLLEDFYAAYLPQHADVDELKCGLDRLGQFVAGIVQRYEEHDIPIEVSKINQDAVTGIIVHTGDSETELLSHYVNGQCRDLVRQIANIGNNLSLLWFIRYASMLPSAKQWFLSFLVNLAYRPATASFDDPQLNYLFRQWQTQWCKDHPGASDRFYHLKFSGSSSLAAKDFKNPGAFVKKLRDATADTDRVSAYLKSKLRESLQRQIQEYKDETAVAPDFLESLVKELNRLLETPLYKQSMFASPKKWPEDLTGEALRERNRWLLEAVYPDDISMDRLCTLASSEFRPILVASAPKPEKLAAGIVEQLNEIIAGSQGDYMIKPISAQVIYQLEAAELFFNPSVVAVLYNDDKFRETWWQAMTKIAEKSECEQCRELLAAANPADVWKEFVYHNGCPLAAIMVRIQDRIKENISLTAAPAELIKVYRGIHNRLHFRSPWPTYYDGVDLYYAWTELLIKAAYLNMFKHEHVPYLVQLFDLFTGRQAPRRESVLPKLSLLDRTISSFAELCSFTVEAIAQSRGWNQTPPAPHNDLPTFLRRHGYAQAARNGFNHRSAKQAMTPDAKQFLQVLLGTNEAEEVAAKLDIYRFPDGLQKKLAALCSRFSQRTENDLSIWQQEILKKNSIAPKEYFIFIEEMEKLLVQKQLTIFDVTAKAEKILHKPDAGSEILLLPLAENVDEFMDMLAPASEEAGINNGRWDTISIRWLHGKIGEFLRHGMEQSPSDLYEAILAQNYLKAAEHIRLKQSLFARYKEKAQKWLHHEEPETRSLIVPKLLAILAPVFTIDQDGKSQTVIGLRANVHPDLIQYYRQRTK